MFAHVETSATTHTRQTDQEPAGIEGSHGQSIPNATFFSSRRSYRCSSDEPCRVPARRPLRVRYRGIPGSRACCGPPTGARKADRALTSGVAARGPDQSPHAEAGTPHRPCEVRRAPRLAFRRRRGRFQSLEPSQQLESVRFRRESCRKRRWRIHQHEVDAPTRINRILGAQVSDRGDDVLQGLDRQPGLRVESVC